MQGTIFNVYPIYKKKSGIKERTVCFKGYNFLHAKDNQRNLYFCQYSQLDHKYKLRGSFTISHH